MSKERYEEFEDAAYTKRRKALLRTKGGPNQEDFLEAARRSDLFLNYMNAVPVGGTRRPALVPEPLTEGEFRAPPQDTEQRLFSAWSDLTPRVACRSTFWARLAYRHIEAGRIESEYLAGNGGNLAGGGERIDRALQASGSGRAKQIDDCTRTILRRLGGIPEVRGHRTVYVDCTFARAWWRERMVNQVAQGDPGVAADVRGVLRSSQNYWEKLVDRVVSRNSTFGSPELRNAFLAAVARSVANDSDAPVGGTDGLQRATQRVATAQGARELSVLSADELLTVMETAVAMPSKPSLDLANR